VVAAKTGIPAITLSRYRRGLTVPAHSIARRLCKVMGWDWPTVAKELLAARLAKVQAAQEQRYVRQRQQESAGQIEGAAALPKGEADGPV
jgi:hypothetical protein